MSGAAQTAGGGNAPAALLRLLEEGGFKEAQLLSVNARKGRFCMRALRDGEALFVKWNDPAMPEHAEALRREKAIFQALKGLGVAAELRESPEALLAVPYLEGAKTLRSFLLRADAPEGEQRCLEAAEAAGAFRARLREAFGAAGSERQETSGTALPELSPAAQFSRHLRQLMTSGPADAPIRRLRRKLNFQWLKAAEKRARADQVLARGLASCTVLPVHGDFHLNNILITGEGMRLIDLEDAALASAEVELAYFAAQAMELTEEGRTGSCFADEIFARGGGENMELYRACLVHYRAAVSVNPRFMRGGRALPLRTRAERWRL